MQNTINPNGPKGNRNAIKDTSVTGTSTPFILLEKGFPRPCPTGKYFFMLSAYCA